MSKKRVLGFYFKKGNVDDFFNFEVHMLIREVHPVLLLVR